MHTSTVAKSLTCRYRGSASHRVSSMVVGGHVLLADHVEYDILRGWDGEACRRVM